MTSALLPSSIADPRFRALAGLLDRALPLDVLDLLQDPKLCVASAIPCLGDQLGVRDPAWHLLSGDAARRALIEQAIALQKTRGTPAGMKAALAAVGLPNVRIIERTKTWAHFRLEWPAGSPPLTPKDISLLLPLVEAWKPTRCVLEGWILPLALQSVQADAFPICHDSTWKYDGTRFHEGDPLQEAYVLVGQGTPLVRINTLTIQDTPNRRQVSFQISEDTANGMQLDCAALYTKSDRLIVASVLPLIEKTAAITINIQWNLLRG